jgi:hypothetical protein
MGVWDMLHLMQQYRKALERADNPAFSPETRAEFGVKADHLRDQMARYIARVEKESKANNLDKRK